MDFLLLNAIYRLEFVSNLALMVDIELQKARFVCFSFSFCRRARPLTSKSTSVSVFSMKFLGSLSREVFL